MESLTTYLKIAEKILNKRKIEISEDLLAHIVEYIARADFHYDAKIGTKEGFRNLYATTAIQNYFFRIKNKKAAINNFDYIFQAEKQINNLEEIEDTGPKVDEGLIIDDIFAQMKLSLDNDEFDIMKTYIENDQSVVKTARLKNVSEQAISMRIKRIREKLRKLHNVLV